MESEVRQVRFPHTATLTLTLAPELVYLAWEDIPWISGPEWSRMNTSFSLGSSVLLNANRNRHTYHGSPSRPESRHLKLNYGNEGISRHRCKLMESGLELRIYGGILKPNQSESTKLLFKDYTRLCRNWTDSRYYEKSRAMGVRDLLHMICFVLRK